VNASKASNRAPNGRTLQYLRVRFSNTVKRQQYARFHDNFSKNGFNFSTGAAFKSSDKGATFDEKLF
jgi:hypothetical protein